MAKKTLELVPGPELSSSDSPRTLGKPGRERLSWQTGALLPGQLVGLGLDVEQCDRPAVGPVMGLGGSH
jgi:hypothetical protein